MDSWKGEGDGFNACLEQQILKLFFSKVILARAIDKWEWEGDEFNACLEKKIKNKKILKLFFSKNHFELQILWNPQPFFFLHFSITLKNKKIYFFHLKESMPASY